MFQSMMRIAWLCGYTKDRGCSMRIIASMHILHAKMFLSVASAGIYQLSRQHPMDDAVK